MIGLILRRRKQVNDVYATFVMPKPSPVTSTQIWSFLASCTYRCRRLDCLCSEHCWSQRIQWRSTPSFWTTRSRITSLEEVRLKHLLEIRYHENKFWPLTGCWYTVLWVYLTEDTGKVTIIVDDFWPQTSTFDIVKATKPGNKVTCGVITWHGILFLFHFHHARAAELPSIGPTRLSKSLPIIAAALHSLGLRKQLRHGPSRQSLREAFWRRLRRVGSAEELPDRLTGLFKNKDKTKHWDK